MTTNLEVSVGRNKYDISCEFNEQEKVVELAQRLNKRVNLLSMALGRLGDTVLLFIAGISIQREVDIAKNETSGKFYEYFVQVSKKVNNIIPASSSLNEKEERDRLFISCLNLENEVYSLTDGEEINYLQQDLGVEDLNKETQISDDSDYTQSEEYKNQMNDIISFFEDLTDNTKKLSAKIKDC